MAGGHGELVLVKHRRELTVLALILACLALGFGGYLLGRSTGTDLGDAEAQGAAAGRARGAEAGSRRGFEIGFRRGHRTGYRDAYPSAYRGAYRQAFEDAGLEPPTGSEIEIE